MKAMVYSEYGMTDVLELKEVDIPELKANEVLVKVFASSVNSWDWDLLRGKPFLTRLGGIRKPRYKILGADIAGRVKAVGENVKHLSVGDEVFGDISGCGWGGFAEYVSVCEEALSLKPADMTFVEAAAIPQAGVLALQALRDKGRVHETKKVLINGAGGGVGTFALQIAKLYGAEVTCVDSKGKLEMLKSIGADHVIDYRAEDFTKKEDQKYDLILDVVGNRSIFHYKKAIRSEGKYVMIGGSSFLILQLLLLGPIINKTERKKMAILLHKPSKEDQNFLKDLYTAGKLVPVIDREYSLNQVPEAIDYLGEGNAKGKVVVCVEDSHS
ncbi:NAD(P)-dependent alcohol dehydrogenase (plasmid) [Niallia taxi]|uniref:NAD(P)-dependent alcohol dehydrogenase n=1 Tax=Niallia taxi TaxID=2499688 RepID=UPI002935274D|nr:NAD(P)-dependent alcohol dehydrogenase [Niallia taxi]WOD64892.1 NAD(P)-dependent alcohol dehydrogenase [Niallia taxi]